MTIQHSLFAWVAAQPAATGLLIFILGILYAFVGFRLFRALLALTCAAIGWVAGLMVPEQASVSPMQIAALLAVLAGVAGATFERPAVLIACSATWAGMGLYLFTQLGIRWPMLAIGCGVCAFFGLLFAWLCHRGMMVILTTMQGASLMVLGFVGLSNSVIPSVGVTFRDWAASQALLVPILLVMVFVTGFSYQSMNQRGDIRSGV